MTLKPLSPTQQAVATYMETFLDTEDRMPSSQEITRHFGWKSQTNAMLHLQRMTAKGFLEHRTTPEKTRGWWRFTRHPVPAPAKPLDLEGCEDCGELAHACYCNEMDP